MGGLSNTPEAGNILARALLTDLVLSLIVVGIQLFMCIYGLVAFLEIPRAERRGRVRYIIISWTLFTLLTFDTFTNVSSFYRAVFYSKSPEDFASQRMKEFTWLSFAGCVACIAASLISDGLLLYRCYLIWNQKRQVLILPLLTYLASFAFSVPFLHPMVERIGWANSNLTFGSLWTFSSVATNILATALISYRLIRSRRKLSPLVDSQDLSLYTGVLAILIESALPLSICGMAYAIILAITKPGDPDIVNKEAASYILSGLYFTFSGLSPQMIIFRVTTGRSWVRQRTGISEATEIVHISKESPVFSPQGHGIYRRSDISDISYLHMEESESSTNALKEATRL
ncbi:hypothetical protein DFP72DRAFT_1066659 [Ephemerocybe angulata]|uniref:Uncharacterized protein n=1 Tax=Ephemerocybe angulata TaxID=980116 RepID=A0A8H6I1P4_9AGAR|nr:hypothetical protein DFP72DRAFT_1066659 [Tulosesus angulatus]